MIQTIHVTQADIDHGVPMECADCPVVRAILRQAPFVTDVAASTVIVWVLFTKDGRTSSISRSTPRAVQSFMNRFDTGQTVSPFSFEIEL